MRFLYALRFELHCTGLAVKAWMVSPFSVIERSERGCRFLNRHNTARTQEGYVGCMLLHLPTGLEVCLA